MKVGDLVKHIYGTNIGIILEIGLKSTKSLGEIGKDTMKQRAKVQWLRDSARLNWHDPHEIEVIS